MKRKTIIIAEIGENHIGEGAMAKEMISQAKLAGSDIVKFQSYKPEDFKKDDPEYDWFKKVSLSDDDHMVFMDFAKEQKIEFMSAPFSIKRAEFLCEKLKIQKIKVASGKMHDINLLKYLNKKCKEVFLSTGMSDLDEIKKSLQVLNNVKVYLLHCVTQYPLKYEDANLRAISTLRKEFPGFVIGYSDHTIGITAPIVAVALGAEVIEKHFTLNKNLEGTDHVLSATPEELKLMIEEIEKTEKLLGDGIKKPRQCELDIKSFVRERFLG